MRALLLALVVLVACSPKKAAAPDFVKGNYPGFTLDVPKALSSRGFVQRRDNSVPNSLLPVPDCVARRR